MDALPYEILQLVASSLMPKYQCRLALTSKHNYQYLYNDLLKWHAHKVHISVPIHKTTSTSAPYCMAGSLIDTGKNVVQYRSKTMGNYTSRFANELYIANYTKLIVTRLFDYGHVEYNSTYQILPVSMTSVYYIYNDLRKYLIKPIYRKHVHKYVLLALINMKRMPHATDIFIRKRIRNLLDTETLLSLQACDHLFALFY